MNAEIGVEAVVFDLFHTLINPEQFLADSHLRAERIAKALDLDPVAFAQYWRESSRARNLARSPTVVERIERHCSELGARRPKQAIDRALDLAGEPDDAALLRPAPSVLEALSTLRERGCRLGVLSNCDERESRMWPRSPLAAMVDGAGLSCDTGTLKPDPEAYAGILRRIGAPTASRAVYVGDGEAHELLGARRAGFARVVLMQGFVRGTRFPGAARLPETRKEADLVIDDLRELLADPVLLWPR